MAKHIHKLLSKDIDTKTGVCQNCGPVDLYYRQGRNIYMCAVAHKTQRGHYTKGIGYMSSEERKQTLSKQSNKCAICTSSVPLVRDHDHDTGKDRGFLCNSCNLGLGKFLDSPNLLEAAAQYLRWHNKEETWQTKNVTVVT